MEGPVVVNVGALRSDEERTTDTTVRDDVQSGFAPQVSEAANTRRR